MADIDTLTLSTLHSMSSYRHPVLLIDGEPYGPSDMTPAGVTGAELVADMAGRFLHWRWLWLRLTTLSDADRMLMTHLVKRLAEGPAGETNGTDTETVDEEASSETT